MKSHLSPADARPFQCRADLERQNNLDSHYRQIGIQSVAAATAQCRKAEDEAQDANERNAEPA